jgi:hypothetical protein
MGPRDSFTWWIINFFIAIAWIAGSVASHNYFFAIGGLVFVALMILLELPGTSSEEGTADEFDLVMPPESATTGPYHSEEQLGGSQGTWRGFGPPPG